MFVSSRAAVQAQAKEVFLHLVNDKGVVEFEALSRFFNESLLDSEPVRISDRHVQAAVSQESPDDGVITIANISKILKVLKRRHNILKSLTWDFASLDDQGLGGLNKAQLKHLFKAYGGKDWEKEHHSFCTGWNADKGLVLLGDVEMTLCALDE